MTKQFAAGLAARLHRLADQLGELRDRVREAVATETGRAVGEAVRDLVTAAVRGRIPVPTTAPFPTAGHRPKHSWDDDPDDWDRDDEDGFDTGTMTSGAPASPASESPPPQPIWAAALAGARAARWWAARTGRGWVGAVIGALTAAAGVVGTPSVRAALAVLTALAGLAAGTVPVAPPGI